MSSFAARIGVSVKTYQHYEYATRAPSLDFIVSVCHKLGVDANWLLGLSTDNAKSSAEVGALKVSALKGAIQAILDKF